MWLLWHMGRVTMGTITTAVTIPQHRAYCPGSRYNISPSGSLLFLSAVVGQIRGKETGTAITNSRVRRQSQLKTPHLYNYPKLAVFLIAATMLLGSGCTPSSPPSPLPPPPPPETGNHPPIIHYIKAEEAQVTPSSSSLILCVASDEDGDPLNYTWSASSGVFEGGGDNITWTAPNISDNCTITVTVTDGKGGTTTSSTSLIVTIAPNRNPVISSLIAEREKIKRNDTIDIECIALDPDGDDLTYIWSSNEESTVHGKIYGEGAKVEWIAPSASGIYHIKVRVIDGKGGEAISILTLNVTCCG